MKFFLKKVAILFFTLLIIMTMTFFLMKAIPGDPFSAEQDMPKEIKEALFSYYGLDKPLYIQYFKYLKGFCTFDFGPSLIYEGRTTTQIIKEGFPISFSLGMESLFLSLAFGIFFGSVAALYKGKWQDSAAILFTTVGISVPNFLLAALLQYIFSIKLGWLPVARWGSFEQSILPAISLALMPTAFIAKLIRANMVEVLQQDYIKTARAKGLRKHQIILKHALRNSILPVISYLGPVVTYIITGSFVIEKIFGIPGLGQWLISSISSRDYPVIMGLAVFFSSLLVMIVYFGDILYSYIDPRMRK